jgi:hypothetical protein
MCIADAFIGRCPSVSDRLLEELYERTGAFATLAGHDLGIW